MSTSQYWNLSEIEKITCDVAAELLDIPREKIGRTSRMIEDLHCDSLDLMELINDLEERFDVTIPAWNSDLVCKSIFSRKEFRIAEFAEAIYVQQGSGRSDRSERRRPPQTSPRAIIQFCQLSGIWNRGRDERLFDPISTSGPVSQFRRRSDGMRSLKIPAATVEVGTDEANLDTDSRPGHLVELDAFLIDAEVVSTTAYCRFLNSLGELSTETLLDWFVLTDDDDRSVHQLIHFTGTNWEPIADCERRPMILVSWYGANAYSLWANGHDWKSYRGESPEELVSFLPTEAQWEYAARGARYREYPWGNTPATYDKMNFARHATGDTYSATSLPLIDVHLESGMSPFGLHQMAGNVWQWCRDWYSEGFYSSHEATQKNACNRSATDIRSERGGSWVGPAELCRSSYRRGRSPYARGRCLGFRCVSDAKAVK